MRNDGKASVLPGRYRGLGGQAAHPGIGTLQEMQKAWKDCNAETTIGGFHAWVYVYSEEELENV